MKFFSFKLFLFATIVFIALMFPILQFMGFDTYNLELIGSVAGIIIIVAIFVYSFIGIKMTSIKSVSDVYRPALEKLALKYNSQIKEYAGHFILEFYLDNIGITLRSIPSSMSNTLQYGTEISAKFMPSNLLEFTISKEGIFLKIFKKMGLQDLKIGDPDFDKKFVIGSNNADFVKSLLTSDIRQKLINISDVNPVISFGGGCLVFNVSDRPKEVGFYEEWIELFRLVKDKVWS